MSDAEFEKKLSDEGFLKRLLGDLDRITEAVTDGAELGAALAGGGIGLAGSIAALYGLGTVGLSTVGITSGLLAAGALIGGGMVAGIGVLAAPVAILAAAGWAGAAALKKERVLRLQSEVLGKARLKQLEIRHALEQRATLSERVAAEMDAREQLLQQIIEGLQEKSRG